MSKNSKNKMDDTIKKIGEDVEYIARSLESSIRDIDFEKESVDFMRGTEKALESLSTTLRRKREEMEDAGVKKTIKKDGRKISKETERTIEDLSSELEKAAGRIRKKKER